jgi:Family of unknown function (DUF6209)
MRLWFFCALSFLVAACSGKASQPSPTVSDDLNEDASVSFTASSWDPSWNGTLRAGGSLRVDYDFARLPQCRNESRLDSWVVDVSWRFDGGPITTASLPGSPGAGETLPDGAIAIPEGAKTIELWFENHAVGGYDNCSAWDSQYGQNYSHAIGPAES